MKVWVVVAPLAGAWLEPGGLLEFCAEMEPRLTQVRQQAQRQPSTQDRVDALAQQLRPVSDNLSARPSNASRNIDEPQDQP